MKRCARCGEEKPDDEFPVDPRRPSRRYSYCLVCKREYMREYRLANPSATKIKQRRDNLRKYGITQADYEAMLVAQDGRCAICGRRGSGTKQHDRMSIDHDHGTGRVRGLLCRSCNKGIGYFDDEVERLDAAIEYLKHHRPEGTTT